MLVKDVDEDDRLIGADEFRASVPVPKRLSCVATRVTSLPVSTLALVLIETVSAPALNLNSACPLTILIKMKSLYVW